MASLIQGVSNVIQGVIQSLFAIVQSFFNLIYSIVYGLFAFIGDVLQNLASFVGASVGFVFSNILIIGLIALGLVLYNDRNKRGTVGNSLKKKVQ